MKLTFGFAAALFLCAATADAQGTSVGVKAGFNLADLSVKDLDGALAPTNRTGLVAGVFVTIPRGPVFAFQPEVLFSMQGAKFTDGSESGTVKIDYVQFPLLARIKPSKSPVGIVVGPSIGYRVRAKLEVSGQEDEDFADQVKRGDVGLVAGVVVDVAHIVLDGRYTWGLANIAQEDSDRIKNRVASITLGFRF